MFKLNHILVIFVLLLLASCNSESAPDCFQNSGKIIRQEVSVEDFTKITVFENVGLILKEGPEIKVEIETGEFLFNEVEVTSENGRLLVKDTNDCNFVRAYGLTKIYVTAPNIDEIRSSTGLNVESEGVLSYPVLRLISESFTNSESDTTDGAFDLNLDANDVSIIVNGITYFQLRGNTENLNITIAAGDSRVDAQNLRANFVSLDHRGSNDILASPQESLTGVLRGTGNVISFERPPIIDLERLYKGELIFRD